MTLQKQNIGYMVRPISTDEQIIRRVIERLKGIGVSKIDPSAVKVIHNELSRYYPGSSEKPAFLMFVILREFYNEEYVRRFADSIINIMLDLDDPRVTVNIGRFLNYVGFEESETRAIVESVVRHRVDGRKWLEIVNRAGIATDEEKDEYQLLKQLDSIPLASVREFGIKVLNIFKPYMEKKGERWLIEFAKRWNYGHLLVYYLTSVYDDLDKVRFMVFQNWDRFTALSILRFNGLLTDEELTEYSYLYYSKISSSPVTLPTFERSILEKYGVETLNRLQALAEKPAEVDYILRLHPYARQRYSVPSSRSGLTGSGPLRITDENVLSEHEFRRLGVVEVRRTNTVHVPVERVSRDARRIARQMIEKNFVKYVSHAGAREVLSLFVNKGKGSFGLNLFARHYSETFAVRLGYHVYTDKVKLLTDASEAGIPYGIILHDFIAEALRTGCDVEDVVRWVIKTGDMHLIQLLCTEYELDSILYRELRNEGVSWDIIINVFFNSRKMDAMITYLSNELGAMEPYLKKYGLPDYDPLFENPLFLNQLFSLKGTSAYEILFKMNKDKALALLVEGLRDNTVGDGEFWALLERVYRNRYAVLNALISEGYDDVIVSLIKKNESEYLVKMFFMYVLTAGKERAIDVYRDYGLIDPLLERMSPKLMKKMGPLALDLVINSEDFVSWLYRFNNLFAPEEVYTCLKKRFPRTEALSMVDAVYGKGTALKIAEKEGPNLALKTAHLILTEDEFYDYVNRLGIEALMEYGDRRLRLDFIAKRMKESPDVSRTIKELRGIAPPGDLLSAFETNGGTVEEFMKTAGIRVTLNALVDLERYPEVLKLLVKRYGKSKTARWAVSHLPLKEVLKNAADLGLERAVVDEFFRRIDMDDRQKIELLESVYGLGKTVNLMVATHRTLSVYDYLVEKFSSETAFTTMVGLLGEKRAMKEAVIAGYTSGAVSALIKKGYSASDCYALVYAVTGSVSRTWRILRSVLTEEEIVDGAWRIGHGIKLVRYLSRKHVLGMENTYELIKRVKGIKEAVCSMFEASKHNPAFRRLLVMREEEFVPILAKKYGEKRAFGYLVHILGFENAVKTFARGLYGLRDSALSVSSVDSVTSSRRDTGSSRVPQPV